MKQPQKPSQPARRGSGSQAGSRQSAALVRVQALQQTVTLSLAVFGFLFCLLSSWRLSVDTPRLVWTAVFLMLTFAILYSTKRWGILLLVFFLVADFWGWKNANALLQGLLLLVEQAFRPLSLELPDVLQQLLAAHEEAQALLYSTMALQAILFLVALFSGYFVFRRSSAAGLACSTLPLLLPAPFYQLAPSILPFFCLVSAHLMVFVLNGARYSALPPAQEDAIDTPLRRRPEIASQRTTQHVLPLAALPLIALAILLSLAILPEAGYTRPESIEDLQQEIFSLQLGKNSILKSNDGLTHGDLSDLSSIRFTGATALKIRTTLEQPLYLRDFAGAVYTDGGWQSVSNAEYAGISDRFLGIAPQNLCSGAYAAASASAGTYTISVRNIAAAKTSIWAPNGLITTAGEIPGAVYLQDTALGFEKASSAGEYSINALSLGATLSSMPLSGSAADSESLKNAYHSAAGAAMNLPDSSGEKAQQVKSAADAYIDYVFQAYATLPESTMQAAQRLVAEYGLSLQGGDGSLDLYETCRALYLFLSERCVYAYSPPKTPDGVDFATFFLEESRQGYCVHFATTATVLLRALGIPARYAEGYIVIPSDYEKEPDADGYINIEDTHAHAWIEVFDPVQLEWIPVEMTASTGSDPSSPADNGRNETETSASPEPTPTAEPVSTPEPTPTAESTAEPSSEPDVSGEPTVEPGLGGTPEPTGSAEGEPSPSEAALSQTPAPDGEDASSAETESSSDDGDSAGPVLWPLIVAALASAMAFAAFALRKYAVKRLKRRMLQKDTNAAVLALCRFAVDMLRTQGCTPLLPLQSPEEYALAAAERLPWLNSDGLQRLLEFAWRARFSKKACSRSERDEALGFVRSLSVAIAGRLPRLRRWFFRLRFPVF
ncbi:MAG: hypothetical protein LLF75_00190 [Eubacteriales bacterium]|nr:hypothetical protein [Eubacteriales bacterium]